MNSLWFDNLARRAIDPALEAVKREAEGQDPDYIAVVPLAAPASRDRCLLSITNRHVTRPQMSGTLSLAAGSGETVRITRSLRWLDNGQPVAVTDLNSAEVTEAKVKRIARDFVDHFFAQLPEGTQRTLAIQIIA